MYGERDVQLHAFLTLALDVGEWSTSLHFPERALVFYWIGGLLDL